MLPEQIVSSVLKEVFHETFSGLKGLAKALGNAVHDKDLFGTMAERYRAYAHQRYGHIRILGMHHPIPLPDIYTRVSVHTRLGSRKYIENPLNLSENASSIHSYPREEETILGIDVVNVTQYLMLLGAPGSGKSTFMRHLLLQAIDGKLKHNLIPVFISFNDVSKSSLKVLDAISDEFRHAGITNPESFVDELLSTGKCLLLLDGLDELSSNRRAEIIPELIRLTARFSSCRWVISCRLAAYNFWFEQFTDVEIANFGEIEASIFVRSWFRDEPQDADHLLGLFAKQQRLRELAGTPLILTMMCIAHEDSLDLSSNRAELYRDAIDALLRKWDISRHVLREEIYRGLNTKKKLDLISRIAAETYGLRLYYFSGAQVAGIIRNFLAGIEESERDVMYIDPSSVLDTIDAQHGIITQRGRGVYTFSHFTFHEYFCAVYLASMDSEVQKDIVRMYAHDVSWREILILLCNFASSADVVVLSMAERMTDFTGSIEVRAKIREAQFKIAEERMPEFLKRRPDGSQPVGTPYLTLVPGEGRPEKNIEDILSRIRYLNRSVIDEYIINLEDVVHGEVMRVFAPSDQGYRGIEGFTSTFVQAFLLACPAFEQPVHRMHVHLAQSNWGNIQETINKVIDGMMKIGTFEYDTVTGKSLDSDLSKLYSILASYVYIIGPVTMENSDIKEELALRVKSSIDSKCEECDRRLERDPFFVVADLLGSVLTTQVNLSQKTRDIAMSALLSAFEAGPPNRAA